MKHQTIHLENGDGTRRGRVRSDFDSSYAPRGYGYSDRYCRCNSPLHASELPVAVRIYSSALKRKRPTLAMRKYYWDVTAAQWQAIRWFIFILDNRTCVYCGGEADTIDHVIPVIKGGSYHPDNCVAACRSCNSKKWATYTPNVNA